MSYHSQLATDRDPICLQRVRLRLIEVACVWKADRELETGPWQLKAADGKVVLVGMEMDILPTTCGYRWCAERTDDGQTRCKL